MKRILMLLLLVTFIVGCTSMKDMNNTGRITATGTIKKLGITTFQYGTHVLKAEHKTYALKSEQINLDLYLDKKVMIEGKKISGYPLDDGPELIDVTLIKF